MLITAYGGYLCGILCYILIAKDSLRSILETFWVIVILTSRTATIFYTKWIKKAIFYLNIRNIALQHHINPHQLK